MQTLSKSLNKCGANLRRRCRQHINGERSQPVFTFIIAAGDVRKRSLRMCGGGTHEDLACRTIARQGCGYTAHAPRPAKVQSIKVHEFWIRAIGDDCRLKQSLRLIVIDAGKKPMEPTR